MIKGDVSLDKIMAYHCNDCQKFSGAPFRAVAVIAADDVKNFGTVNEFLKITESGYERLQDFAANEAVIFVQLTLPKRCL